MVGIYLAAACVAVILVAVFVDDLPADLVERKTNLRSQVKIGLTFIIATTLHCSSVMSLCEITKIEIIFDLRAKHGFPPKGRAPQARGYWTAVWHFWPARLF